MENAANVSDQSIGSRLEPQVMFLIGICALIYLLDGLIHSILGPLAPDIARTLALSNAELGPIFSANLIGQCIGLVTFPLFAGRLGQRNIVLIALTGYGLCEFGAALASSGNVLFAWRLVTGIFLGGCLPSCLAIVTSAAPKQRRGLAIMMLFTGYGLGATLSGIVAAAYANNGGWRMALASVGAVCIATTVLAWFRLQPVSSERTEGTAPEAPGARPFRVLGSSYLVGTLMLWLMFISMLTISYCLNSWLPTLLVETGRDETLAALSVSIFALGGIIAALGVGLLIDRLGATPTLASFVTVSTVLLFLVGRVLESASAEVLLVLLGACGFFVLGAYGGVNVILASFYPDDLRAIGIGWAKSVSRIGTVIAPILIGIGLTAGISGATIMSLFAVPALLSVVSILVIALVSRRTEADTGATQATPLEST